MQKRGRLIVSVLFIVAVFLAAVPVLAAGRYTVGGDYTVGRSQVVDDDLFVGAAKVDLMGEVRGDALAIGRDIEVPGQVEGGAFLAGQTVSIAGDINGSLRAFAQGIALSGHVGRNMAGLASEIVLDRGAVVERSLTLAGQNITVNGRVNGNAKLSGGRVIVGGWVAGNLNVNSEELIIDSGARIDGVVTYEGRNAPRVAAGATLDRERMKFRRIVPDPAKPMQREIVDRILALVKFMVFGVLLALFASKGVRRLTGIVRERPFTAIGAGLVLAIAAPIAAVLLAVIVVGQSAAWAILFGYMALLAVAAVLFKVLFAMLIGQLVLGAIQREKGESLLWPAVIGTLIMYLLELIPVVGPVVDVVAFVLILGSLVVPLGNAFSWPGKAVGE